MIYIYGKRFVGRVDSVPGLCYIVTLFAHGFWFPLLPMQSYLVLAGPGERTHIPIPTSTKSVVVGYVRAISAVVAVWWGLATYGRWNLINPYTNQPEWQAPAAITAVAFATLVSSYAIFWRATPKRMAELASTPGLPTSISNELSTRVRM
jgi:hypothetical protein